MIDVVAPLVAAVKFQSAFYEAYGPAGVAAMHATASYAHEKNLIVIIDGKRNDIGSTAEAYARGYLGKVPDRRLFRAVVAGRRPHRQSLLRQRRRLAVHQSRRQGTERGLRPGSDE